MDSAKKAADDLPAAIADARKTIQAATEVIQKASTGKGALATLLSNQEFANDLRALISNLRAHGILFYRDSAAKEEARAAASAQNQPRTRDPDDASAHRKSAAGPLRHVLRGDWRHRDHGNARQSSARDPDRGAFSP